MASDLPNRFDLLKNTPDAVVVSGDDDRVIFWNRAAEDLYRMPASEALGQPLEQLIGFAAAGVGREEVRSLVKEGGSWQGEAQVLPKNEPPVWVHWSVSTCELDDGTPGCLAIAREITGSKRTEEALRESGERGRKQRAAIVGLTLEDESIGGDLREIFKKACETLSRTIDVARTSVWQLSADGLELRCLNLYEAESGEHSRGVVLNAQDMPKYFGAIKAESRIYAEDVQNDPRTDELTEGYLRPLGIASMLDAGIVIDGELFGVVCSEHVGEKRKWLPDEESFVSTIAAFVAQLIVGSGRRRVLEELRESEERFAQSAKQSRTFTWEVDGDGLYTYVNPVVEDVTGFAPEEIIGRLRFYELHPESGREAFKDAALAIFRRKDSFSDLENPIQTKWGRPVWVSTSGIPMLNPDGTLLGYRGSDTDITERVQAVRDRENLQDQLTQAQKMESVGRLAGGIAHDFNNMLGVILGQTGLALDGLNPATPLFHTLSEIQKAAERSAEVTGQLLTFARRQTVTPRILDLNGTVEGIFEMLRRLIGENIDLVWRPGVNLGPVRMDPSQIDQMLANLCINARDAIAEVGRITLETETVTLDEAYCAEHLGSVPGDYVLLAVSDNGKGMDQGVLANIFEPFFTTKEVGEGTGLGLATVYGIVKQNDGYISVESEPGHGTTFKIYLPVHADKADQAQQEIDLGKPTERGQETVLLVEDEPALLTITAQMLERQGYAVLTSSTPAEAIRLATSFQGRIDLLLTDVVMPEMNGRDLARRLLVLRPEMKRLFMSGYTANVIADHGILDHGVQFIQKPFSMKNMAIRIREVLDQE